ncbi:hypothetical protein CYMTET_23630 [Cymbomonas tetramitiformis]|uniref:Uncharacterized protein n=1 Tax=Cymbomonas tetramitiformis TaxID=36881 RepID=A0AAE0FXX8_9CHLO|nr:hypothetical protein CYMTET_23630 [Cymbomonas tetramitiformis]|eukprot:gene16140-19147_t
MASLSFAPLSVVPTRVMGKSPQRNTRLVVNSENGSSDASVSESKVYFTNKAGARVSGSPAEYREALEKGDMYAARSPSETIESSPGASSVSLGDAMGFSGAGPEIINGRLAMFGFVAAAGAELSSHKTVIEQFGQEPTLIILAVSLLAAGSLVTALKDAKVTEGLFSTDKEMVNGRVAMLGFTAMLLTEKFTGHSVF